MERRNRPKTVNVECASDVHINNTPEPKRRNPVGGGVMRRQSAGAGFGLLLPESQVAAGG